MSTNDDSSCYRYTNEQLEAMFQAYREAPDDTTVAELIVLMDAAAAKVADQ